MSQHKLIAGVVSVAFHVVLLGVLALHVAARPMSVGVTEEPQMFEVRLVRSPARDFAAVSDAGKQMETVADAAAGGGGAARPESGGEASPPESADRAEAAPAEASYMSGGDYLDYQRRLLAHIRPYQFYPDAGRRGRLEGVVRVGFVLQRDGRVREVWVESSSGYAVLDEAAMDTVRRAQPLPLIPAILPDSMDVMLPIAFSAPAVLGRG